MVTTKTITCSLGTLEVRGLTAGEATKSADMQKSIDRLYDKDIEKHAEEVSKMTFSMLAKCIVSVNGETWEGPCLEDGLRDAPVNDVALLNQAIQDATSLPEDIKKNSSPS